MYNWSINTKQLKKDKEKYAVWRLEQAVNFGLAGKKLSRKDLKKYWPKLKLDPAKKEYLRLILWQ